MGAGASCRANMILKEASPPHSSAYQELDLQSSSIRTLQEFADYIHGPRKPGVLGLVQRRCQILEVLPAIRRDISPPFDSLTARDRSRALSSTGTRGG
jgi:hypothetical protein